MTIESRVPRDIYLGLPGINITRLKELRRSPQHYRYALDHPKESDAMTLGIATHVAVLEPERFEKQFAVWTKRTDAGAMSPRRGKDWDEFSLLNASRTILTQDEARISKEIAKAVRSDATAMKYLEAGDPEVTLEWTIGERHCKGRIDWFIVMGGPVIVGVISWSTGPNGSSGCGGLTGVTPLARYRDWVLDAARRMGSPVGP